MPKAIVNYSQDREADLASFSKSVYQSMLNNVNFPNPTPALPAVLTAVDDYSNALVAAATRDRVAISKKNKLKADLLAVLNTLGNYVNLVAEGRAEIIDSSGFRRSKDREPVKLEVPVILSVDQSEQPGAVMINCAATKGASSYVYQATPDPITPDSIWKSVPDGRSKFEFTGLKEGALMWFKVIAVGTNSQTTESTEVPQYVALRSFKAAA